MESAFKKRATAYALVLSPERDGIHAPELHKFVLSEVCEACSEKRQHPVANNSPYTRRRTALLPPANAGNRG